ncbi:MAG: CinA family protein [Opitutales bacterium]
MNAIVESLAKRLTDLELTVVTAESCTGGLIGHWLTDWPGSSRFYLGGIQAYSNAVKQAQLAVPEAIIEQFGAVSEACAKAMAEGARKGLGADFGISVTGIAGPGGGTPEKPVGLVYCAVAGPQGTFCSRNIWTGSRSENKQASAREALELLARYLNDHGNF